MADWGGGMSVCCTAGTIVWYRGQWTSGLGSDLIRVRSAKASSCNAGQGLAVVVVGV